MKKTIKASPIMAIIMGFASVVCVVLTIAEIASGGGSTGKAMLGDTFVIGAFIFYLMKYLSREKIEFDESTFTVDGKDYRFGEITNVTVDSEQVLRNVSTLRIRLYIGEEEIYSFTKDDDGAEDFIALMKKHGVSVSIDT